MNLTTFLTRELLFIWCFCNTSLLPVKSSHPLNFHPITCTISIIQTNIHRFSFHLISNVCFIKEKWAHKPLICALRWLINHPIRSPSCMNNSAKFSHLIFFLFPNKLSWLEPATLWDWQGAPLNHVHWKFITIRSITHFWIAKKSLQDSPEKDKRFWYDKILNIFHFKWLEAYWCNSLLFSIHLVACKMLILV